MAIPYHTISILILPLYYKILKHFFNLISTMATIKVKFRPSNVPNHEGTIFYQIIHDRKQRQFFPDYHVFPKEWDKNRSMVTTTQTSERKSIIHSIRERIRWDIERLNKIIRKLDNDGLTYAAYDVIDEFNRHFNDYSLFNYMER